MIFLSFKGIKYKKVTSKFVYVSVSCNKTSIISHMNCCPLLCVVRLGVPARQRPLHACALRLPWRLLHVLSGPDGGWQRG